MVFEEAFAQQWGKIGHFKKKIQGFSKRDDIINYVTIRKVDKSTIRNIDCDRIPYPNNTILPKWPI